MNLNPEIHTTFWPLVLCLTIGSLVYELGKWAILRYRKSRAPEAYSFEIVWPVGRVATEEELSGMRTALDAFLDAAEKGAYTK